MTTSPFGAPNPFGGPSAAPEPSAAAAPATSRKPLLFAVGGVAAVAALGAGAFFLLSPDEVDEPLAVTPPAAGGGAVDEPTDEETAPAEPVLATQSSRNPFAALVLAGGGGAAATAPEATPASSGGGSTVTTGGGGGGTPAPATPGEKGDKGDPGPKGDPGAKGPAGSDGKTPTWVTLVLDDVQESADSTGSFTVRNAAGEYPVTGVTVDDPIYQFGPTVSVVVTGYDDVDADGQVDRVQLAVVGASAAPVPYSLWVGQAVPLFFTP